MLNIFYLIKSIIQQQYFTFPFYRITAVKSLSSKSTLSKKMNYSYKTPLLTSISIFTITLALIVISGWLFDITVFKTIIPDYVSMKINTAIGFLLSGTIFLCLTTNRWSTICRFTALLLFVFGVATFSQNIFNYDLGIDQFLITDFDNIKKGIPYPGRPSPTTAFCFSLYGLALLGITSQTSHFKKLAQYCLHIITLLSFIALLGYLFTVPLFYKFSFLTNIAVHTALAFFILSIATSFIQKNMGITGIFTGTNIGNLMSRNLFPKMAIAILLLTSLELFILRHKLISQDFGITLLATSFILISLYFIASTSSQLNQIDIKRIKAENKIIKANKNLEKIVVDRTMYLTTQNKQLEDFAHIISHNLRGPVSNLHSLLNFYKEEETIEEKDELMEMFEKTVNNIGSTLNELLEVVSIRHESKKDREKIIFETVFSKITTTFQGQILELNADVSADFSEAPEIEYSSTYLESIMQNLLSNALKYHTPNQNPVIHFATTNTDGRIELTVSDNGLGIDLSKNGSRLFGLHKTFHKHPEAKGIGLFLTKTQVEAMGGTISATSKVNEGTTFKIVFNPSPTA